MAGEASRGCCGWTGKGTATLSQAGRTSTNCKAAKYNKYAYAQSLVITLSLLLFSLLFCLALCRFHRHSSRIIQIISTRDHPSHPKICLIVQVRQRRIFVLVQEAQPLELFRSDS